MASSARPKSGLRVHYRIETTDGKVIDVTTAMIDMLRWEKDHAGKSWFDAQSITAALWVAWAAGKRQGVIDGIDQAGWAATVVDFEAIDDEPESDEPEALRLDPTPEAPSA
jgi:hypothetical protein